MIFSVGIFHTFNIILIPCIMLYARLCIIDFDINIHAGK